MNDSNTTPLEALLRQVMPELRQGVHLGWCAQTGKGRPAEYAGGRNAARQALKRGGQRDDVTLLTEAATGLPRWPAGWVGSISHSRGKCVAGVVASAHFCGIGLDLEHLGRMRAGTIRKVCSDEELAELPEGQAHEAATRLFSLKEAFYKAQSPIFRLEPNFSDLSLSVNYSSRSWTPGIRRKSGVLAHFDKAVSMFSWTGYGMCLSLVLIEAEADGAPGAASGEDTKAT